MSICLSVTWPRPCPRGRWWWITDDSWGCWGRGCLWGWFPYGNRTSTNHYYTVQSVQLLLISQIQPGFLVLKVDGQSIQGLLLREAEMKLNDAYSNEQPTLQLVVLPPPTWPWLNNQHHLLVSTHYQLVTSQYFFLIIIMTIKLLSSSHKDSGGKRTLRYAYMLLLFWRCGWQLVQGWENSVREMCFYVSCLWLLLLLASHEYTGEAAYCHGKVS